MKARTRLGITGWIQVTGSPDYISVCGRYVSVYDRTDQKGFGLFRVFPVTLPKSKRSLKTALAVGGLI